MFHTYNFGSALFQDWLEATNQLYYTQHLELGRRHQDFVFAGVHDINAQPQDQFLLFCDDEAGICGSAAIIALPYDLEIEGQIIPQGTWMLRNVFFHLRAGHPVLEHPDKSIRIVEQFHLGLFEHLWQLAQTSGHKIALSLQHDLEAHEDLEFYGGFTFTLELLEEDQSLPIAMAIVPLTKKTYQTYARKKQKSFKKINLVNSFLSPHRDASFFEVNR